METHEFLKKIRSNVVQPLPDAPNNIKALTFAADNPDVKAVFTDSDYWQTLLETGRTEFHIGERAIAVYLPPDSDEMMTIIIFPVKHEADGRVLTTFPVAGSDRLTEEEVSKLTFDALTDQDFQTRLISDKANFMLLPKDMDKDEFISSAEIRVIPPHGLSGL